MDILEKYRWLIKDTHGIDFFLNRNFVDEVRHIFGKGYIDEELMCLFHSQSDKDGEEFVPSLIRLCDPARLLDYTLFNPHELSEPAKNLGVKDKKIYEIARFSHLVESVAKEAQISYLVDFGGGLGHMASRMTSLGFKVIVIDCDQTLLSKLPLQIHSIQSIQSICMLLTENKLGELEGRLMEMLNGEPCLFYSLHACGSLSDCMIKLFCNMFQAKGIVNVGCCYNRIDYSIGQSQWSMNEKMAACQCPSAWMGNYEDTVRSFWLNYYRAIVQDVAKRKAFPLENPKLGNIKLPDPANHSEYFRQVFEKTGLHVESHEYEDYVQYRRLYSTWWTVRAALGQLIEAQIIKERLDYIQKYPHSYLKVFRIFDVYKSPRNYAIVARK